MKRIPRSNNFPLPFDPNTGKFPGLSETHVREPGMMQVIEADTHDSYVVCRGFDPEFNKFFYTVNVAKPYGERGTTGVYNVGEIYTAIKPRTLLGLSPGKSSSSTGHPADLNESVELLTDDSGKVIQWIFCGKGVSSSFQLAKLTSTLSTGGTATADIYTDPETVGESLDEVNSPPWHTGDDWESGEWVEVFRWGEKQYVNLLRCVSDDGGDTAFITNLQVSGTELQYKAKTVGGDESGWTTWHTGSTCEE